jgi:hypothetical protein
VTTTFTGGVSEQIEPLPDRRGGSCLESFGNVCVQTKMCAYVFVKVNGSGV